MRGIVNRDSRFALWAETRARDSTRRPFGLHVQSIDPSISEFSRPVFFAHCFARLFLTSAANLAHDELIDFVTDDYQTWTAEKIVLQNGFSWVA